MSSVLVFDPSGTFLEMVRFVVQGWGIELHAFNDSPKNLYDLYKEVQRREITLIIDTDGFVKRIVRNVKIVMNDPTRNRAWIEVARSYPNGTIIQKEREYAIRETCRYQEAPYNTAVRGLEKELGYVVGKTESTPSLLPLPIGWTEPDYFSTVYPGIMTRATSTWYELTLGDFLQEDHYKVRKDDEDSEGDPNAWVEIHLIAIPFEERAPL